MTVGGPGGDEDYLFSASEDGSVTVWGNSGGGGANAPSSVTSPAAAKRVVSIASTTYAFAALHSDGTVTTWGWSEGGGEVPVATQALLVDVVATSTRAAAAAAPTGGPAARGAARAAGSDE